MDLATLPLYVRAGAILPLDPVRQYTGQPTRRADDDPRLPRRVPLLRGRRQVARLHAKAVHLDAAEVGRPTADDRAGR